MSNIIYRPFFGKSLIEDNILCFGYGENQYRNQWAGTYDYYVKQFASFTMIQTDYLYFVRTNIRVLQSRKYANECAINDICELINNDISCSWSMGVDRRLDIYVMFKSETDAMSFKFRYT